MVGESRRAFGGKSTLLGDEVCGGSSSRVRLEKEGELRLAEELVSVAVQLGPGFREVPRYGGDPRAGFMG